MIVLEALIAISFAKYGGGLATGGQFKAGAEQVIGWLFLLAGLCMAVVIGKSL